MPMWLKNAFPRPLRHHQQPEQVGSMDSCSNFDPTIFRSWLISVAHIQWGMFFQSLPRPFWWSRVPALDRDCHLMWVSVHPQGLTRLFWDVFLLTAGITSGYLINHSLLVAPICLTFPFWSLRSTRNLTFYSLDVLFLFLGTVVHDISKRSALTEKLKPAHIIPTIMLRSKSPRSHFPAFWCLMWTLPDASELDLQVFCSAPFPPEVRFQI